MKKPYCSIKIHPITVIYIILALFTRRFVFLFIHYFVALIHELSHCLSAKLLKIHINEFSFLPFGFYARIDDLEWKPLWKQLIVLISGPASYFLSWVILLFLYQNNVLSIYGYRHGLEANLIVLIFNLLPIFPLDGGSILRLIFLKIFPEKEARIGSLVVTSVTSIGLIWLCYHEQQMVIAAFAILNIFAQLLAFKKEYRFFLLKRLISKKRQKVRILAKPCIYRFNDNYYQKGATIYDEKHIIHFLLDRER